MIDEKWIDEGLEWVKKHKGDAKHYDQECIESQLELYTLAKFGLWAVKHAIPEFQKIYRSAVREFAPHAKRVLDALPKGVPVNEV